MIDAGAQAPNLKRKDIAGTNQHVSRAAVIALYALLVLIWSSTWVAIKIGLEDCPPLLGAAARFASAGLVLLGVTLVRRRSLRTDARLAGILRCCPLPSPTGSSTGASSTSRPVWPPCCSAFSRSTRR